MLLDVYGFFGQVCWYEGNIEEVEVFLCEVVCLVFGDVVQVVCFIELLLVCVWVDDEEQTVFREEVSVLLDMVVSGKCKVFEVYLLMVMLICECGGDLECVDWMFKQVKKQMECCLDRG